MKIDVIDNINNLCKRFEKEFPETTFYNCYELKKNTKECIVATKLSAAQIEENTLNINCNIEKLLISIEQISKDIKFIKSLLEKK